MIKINFNDLALLFCNFSLPFYYKSKSVQSKICASDTYFFRNISSRRLFHNFCDNIKSLCTIICNFLIAFLVKLLCFNSLFSLSSLMSLIVIATAKAIALENPQSLITKQPSFNIN